MPAEKRRTIVVFWRTPADGREKEFFVPQKSYMELLSGLIADFPAYACNSGRSVVMEGLGFNPRNNARAFAMGVTT